MSDLIYLNGEYLPLSEAKISVLDRGFLFGDGVYEVIPAYAGRLFRLQDHIARLDNSLNGIRLPLRYSLAEWLNIFQPLLANDRDQYLYLQVTRGYAPKRDHGFPETVTPTVFVMCSDTKPFAGCVTGVSAITVQDNRWQRCDIKATALLAHLLLRQEAQDQGGAEALILRDGHVTEGAASNVFAVIDDVLITPPKSHEILAGITRDVIVELAHAKQIAVSETLITEADLRRASEIWVTSSIREIVPVIKLDGQAVGTGQPGPVFVRMNTLFQAYKQSLV